MLTQMMENREVRKLRELEKRTGINPLLSKNIDISLLHRMYKGLAKTPEEKRKCDILIEVEELKSMHYQGKKMTPDQFIEMMKETPKDEIDCKEIFG